MKRTLLIVVASVMALACVAQYARAKAREHSAAPGASAATNAARFPPVPSPTASRKIDEYGNLRWGDERARLDNLAIEMRNDPTAVAYLVCYGGRRAREREAPRRCARAASYLKRAARAADANVVTIDGGFREDLTVELWLLPVTIRPPAPGPTVDPSEVTIVRDAPRRKRTRRGARVKPARAPTR